MPDDAAPAHPLGLTITVSIVNYGGSAMILAALPSLLTELKRFRGHDVVIVDNASPDGDAERLEAGLRAFAGEAVRLIHAPVNGGFAAGNNIVFADVLARAQRPNAVFLLNPDAEVRPGAVEALAATLVDKPRAATVGPKLENPDGSIMQGAFNYPSPLGEFARNTGLSVVRRLAPVMAAVGDDPVRVDWVTGAAQLIRTEAIEAVDGMDAAYFLYFDETDMARRLQRRGWEAWHVPAATVAHIAGATTGVQDGKAARGRMPRYWFESWLRYFIRHEGHARARLAALGFLAGLIVQVLQRRLRGRRVELPQRYVRDVALACLFGHSRVAHRPRVGCSAVDPALYAAPAAAPASAPASARAEEPAA
ncbi:MAG: glycosyltransferase family 2 protein [Pseudomonadota bacterium]